jgi:hypothetical protein
MHNGITCRTWLFLIVTSVYMQHLEVGTHFVAVHIVLISVYPFIFLKHELFNDVIYC